MVRVVWHGSRVESEMLARAISTHCNCEFNGSGLRTSTCGPHEMLIQDQRALDGLLFGRNIRERLLDEEFGTAGAVTASEPGGALLSNS
jgi:hypothetical protein